MDPAGTVDSFSSSSSSSLPTPNPHPSSHSSIQPSSAANPGMVGQEINIAVLASQFQQLLAATAVMQQQLSSLMPSRVDSDVHPVDLTQAPTAGVDGPVDAPVQAVQSEPAFAPAAPAVSFPSHSPPSSHVAKLKVATPDAFTGDLAKSEEFINSLHLYFYGKQGVTDEEKITFALSYMKGGRAGKWSKNKIQEYSKAERGPSWDEFLADFREMFSDPDPSETARYKLTHLRQGNRPAEDYVADFKEVMDETGFNDAALAYMFEKGLSSKLVNAISHTLPGLPKNLKEWMTTAVSIDRFHRAQAGKHGFNAFSYSTTSNQAKPPSHQPPRQTAPVKTPPSASTSSSEIVPMEVDTTRKKAETRVCFTCKQPGHIAKYCKAKFNINEMNYGDLKAHFKKELEEEAKKAKEEKEAKEGQDF